MERIEEIIDFIEQTGEKCVIVHQQRGAYVVLKADEYQSLLKEKRKRQEIESFGQPDTDVRLYEVPRIKSAPGRFNDEDDIYYPEPLD